MAKPPNNLSSNEILSQTEVIEGGNKVIITEYDNGARSYRTVRPPKPWYRSVWFYAVVVAILGSLFALLGS